MTHSFSKMARAPRLFTNLSSSDVQRHDEHRGSIGTIGPIEKVYEGMQVVDADGDDVGKVEFVKMGDPGAFTTKGQDVELMPRLPRPFAERMLRMGYVAIDLRAYLPGTPTPLRQRSIAWRTTRQGSVSGI